MLRLFSRLLFFAFVIFMILVFLKKPTNDRSWTAGFEKLAEVRVENQGGAEFVSIKNLRDSTYEDGGENIRYFSEEFNPENIEKMWFLVEPFAKLEALAHTFFIFDFADGKTLAFSVEARKEKGEKFSALRGLFREYELYYLFGTERDLILRRTDFLDHDLYMYPVKTTKENLKALFLNIAKEARKLEAEPTFYNTVTSSCTTTLVKHINLTSPGKVAWWRIGQYLPGLSDRLAFDLDLLETEKSFAETRERYSIKEKANNCEGAADFSACLRAALD